MTSRALCCPLRSDSGPDRGDCKSDDDGTRPIVPAPPSKGSPPDLNFHFWPNGPSETPGNAILQQEARPPRAYPSQDGRAKTASGADVAGDGLHWGPPQPIFEAESGPRAHGRRRQGGCSSTACQDQHLESFSAAGAPSPSAGVMIRKLGPVSDTSFYAVSPAKSQELWGGRKVEAQGE
ncbi:hypothetical protein mRhiFer1_008649 [Rhinolophus ferrumequinum]|uniref:Uncharacterized protein n=1 Tax=Rhinolophus ferrumequinum TaxID=59479 RepID=A0A7J7U129_RHIFE|nr:hypothetical protein mRhiFer1_008649 [Rhinolophus ferrumequinum]